MFLGHAVHFPCQDNKPVSQEQSSAKAVIRYIKEGTGRARKDLFFPGTVIRTGAVIRNTKEGTGRARKGLFLPGAVIRNTREGTGRVRKGFFFPGAVIRNTKEGASSRGSHPQH